MFGITPFADAPFADLGGGPLTLTGLSATGSMGTVTFSFPRTVDVTSIVALASMGDASVLVQYAVQVSLTGINAAGTMQNVLVWGIIDDSQTPNWVQIPT